MWMMIIRYVLVCNVTFGRGRNSYYSALVHLNCNLDLPVFCSSMRVFVWFDCDLGPFWIPSFRTTIWILDIFRHSRSSEEIFFFQWEVYYLHHWKRRCCIWSENPILDRFTMAESIKPSTHTQHNDLKMFELSRVEANFTCQLKQKKTIK